MMSIPIEHPSEVTSNAERATAHSFEPRSLRTYTPTQAVLARSAGIYHWTPEGRRLYDFTSGVLVSNLGPQPGALDCGGSSQYMGWPVETRRAALPSNGQAGEGTPAGYFPALPLTAYNAVTPARDRGEQAARRRRCGARPAGHGWSR